MSITFGPCQVRNKQGWGDSHGTFHANEISHSAHRSKTFWIFLSKSRSVGRERAPLAAASRARPVSTPIPVMTYVTGFPFCVTLRLVAAVAP